jgi:hypothetical protein
VIFLVGSQLIHGSRQIWTFVPDPILHAMPFFTRSSPYSTAFHVGDPSLGNTVSIISPYGKYLALSSLAHACLARRA